MKNRILRIQFRDRSLDPARAEVWVNVIPQRFDAGTEVHGRLLGPRCAYAATVEVAYPLRALGVGTLPAGEGLTMRVVIPEASLWEPESPFLYEGPVELWQDGVPCERVTVRHGLSAVGLGPRGLRVNGRPMTLQGRLVRQAPDDARARQLRQEGHNLLVTDVAAQAEQVWEAADRLGFFVLGRLSGADEELSRCVALAQHPSCLGWLAPAGAGFLDRLPSGGLVGIQVPAGFAGPPPAGAHFVLTSAPDGDSSPLFIPGVEGVVTLGSVHFGD